MSTLTIFAYQAWISSYLYFWNNKELIKVHNFIMLKFWTDCWHKYCIFGLYFWEAIMTSIIWEKVTAVCLSEITIVAHEQLQMSHCRWCQLLLQRIMGGKGTAMKETVLVSLDFKTRNLTTVQMVGETDMLLPPSKTEVFCYTFLT